MQVPVVLFQEALAAEGDLGRFWMLVACCLANRTGWHAQAKAAFLLVRGRWPTPSELARSRVTELQAALRPLGLWRARCRSLRLLARAWHEGHRPACADDVYAFPGCGRYASDAWAIFVEGRTDVEVTDGWLLRYLEQRREFDGRSVKC